MWSERTLQGSTDRNMLLVTIDQGSLIFEDLCGFRHQRQANCHMCKTVETTSDLNATVSYICNCSSVWLGDNITKTEMPVLSVHLTRRHGHDQKVVSKCRFKEMHKFSALLRTCIYQPLVRNAANMTFFNSLFNSFDSFDLLIIHLWIFLTA